MPTPPLDVTEYSLLGLLAEEPRHGYALARALGPATGLGQMVRLRRAQLYFYLHKFEREGWIEPVDASASSVAERHRVLRLTAGGRACLEEWLHTPVGRPRDVRLSFVVKLYFALRLQPDRLNDLIADQVAALEDYLAQLTTQTLTPDAPADLRFFHTVVVPQRIAQTRAALAWLAATRQHLTTGGSLLYDLTDSQ
jgi:PadR family transcriptional regulator, regulatory protein AphA